MSPTSLRVGLFLDIFLQIKHATPLLLAASGGHKEVVEVLIGYGALPSDMDAVSNVVIIHYRNLFYNSIKVVWTDNKCARYSLPTSDTNDLLL